jgi:hypothetical protein
MSKKPLSNNADVPWSKPSDAGPPCVKWPSNSEWLWPPCNTGSNGPKGPESTGSPVARSPNALTTAVDTSDGEAPAPKDRAKNGTFLGPFLPCLRLSGLPSAVKEAVDVTPYSRSARTPSPRNRG